MDKDNIPESEGGFDKYLKQMSQNGFWGDGTMLSAAVKLYQRPITLISRNGPNITLDGPQVQPTAPPLFLLYAGVTNDSKEQNHYQSMRPKFSPRLHLPVFI